VARCARQRCRDAAGEAGSHLQFGGAVPRAIHSMRRGNVMQSLPEMRGIVKIDHPNRERLAPRALISSDARATDA